MSDLAKQAAEEIWTYVNDNTPKAWIEQQINDHGVLVSHEDAAWLKLARSTDPLTLDRAVAVMGREPDEENKRIKAVKYYWVGDGVDVSLKIWESDGARDVVINASGYLNPTVGQFALLVAASRQGASE